MVVAVLHAPVFFFDSNPVGRILNRFSRDIGCMDEVLPKTFLQSVQLFLLLFTSILLPTITNPWVLLAVVPIAVSAGLFFKVLLKDIQGASKVGVSLSQSCLFAYFGNLGWTGHNKDTKKRRRICRSLLQVFIPSQSIFFYVNPPSDVHANSYPHFDTRAGGGGWNPPPEFFYLLQYFETILPLVDSLWKPLVFLRRWDMF